MTFILIEVLISVVFAVLGSVSGEPIYWWVSGVAAGVGGAMLEQSLRMARNGA